MEKSNVEKSAIAQSTVDKPSSKSTSLSDKLRLLMLSIFIPMLALMVICITMFIIRNYQYQKVSGNVTLASGFGQDFKDEIDLKMYYYATGSEYATGLPLDEIDRALELANTLSERTSKKDSQRSIRSVINLCGNLKDRILQISETDNYNDKMEQLDTNVYILTDLIQDYMYNYLYSEAEELALLQRNMDVLLKAEVACLVLFTLSLAIISILRAVSVSRSITRPIDELYGRVKSVDAGELIPIEPVQANDEKLQALSNSFEEMIGRLAKQVELNKEEADKIRAMELMLLQAQINPHFLYNTLDTIIWLIETGKNEQAVEMVFSLSNFFRSSLSKGRDIITLKEEEIHVKSYLEIQQVRYKDKLTYDLNFSEEIYPYMIPKLTLQPLVENALYHGIKLKREKGNIKITGNPVGDKIVLTVEDTGIGMSDDKLIKVKESLDNEDAPGFGMAAVYKRLKLVFGSACTFDITSAVNEGTKILICIPMEKEENNNADEGVV